jgi:hypothetical protein
MNLNIGVILVTRICLKTIERKRITALGVKPIGKVPDGVTTPSEPRGGEALTNL